MYYIGFDIGGTKCAVSLGSVQDDTLTVQARQEVPTEDSPTAVFDQVANTVKTWIDTYDVRKAGISCGGPLDAAAGIILSTPNLAAPWHGFEIVAYIRSRFGLEARLENDANASAVAEWKYGAGKGKQNVVFLTFGTGLGAGLIMNGRLYAGSNGNAGEIGHIRLEKQGPIGYNKIGSAEGFCSGGGIQRLCRLRAGERGVSVEADVTTKVIFERASAGDAFYRSVIVESAEQFARVLGILIDLLNPDVIICGGVFMRNYAFFMSVMTPLLEAECLPETYRACRIRPAAIGENVGDYAALAVASTEV